MEEFKTQCQLEEWAAWHHHPVTKEAKRFLLYLVADLKDQWAEGGMVGVTQEETGYLSSMGRAKVLVLQEVLSEIFEPAEREEGQDGKR
jgi:hypothetical protein